MNKWSNDDAFDCDLKVWEKAQLYEVKTFSKLLNIHGDDVATVMKYLQVTPFSGIFNYEIDLKDSSHGMVTYRTCPTLLSLEREGTGRGKQICQQMEPMTFGITAHYFNPNIKVTGLKVPPRTNYNDVACQWEFKLEK